MSIVKVHSLEFTQMETISLEAVLSMFFKSIIYIKYTFCMFKKSMLAIEWYEFVRHLTEAN